MMKQTLAGCDLHDRSMLVLAAHGSDAAQKRTFLNTAAGRAAMLKWLREIAAGEPIVFAYEASGLGFGLHDELVAAGQSWQAAWEPPTVHAIGTGPNSICVFKRKS